MKKYFYTDGSNKYGPFSKDELILQNISRTTKIWYFGIDKWTELSKISEFDDFTSSIPPEIKKIYINSQKSNPNESTNNDIHTFSIRRISGKQIKVISVLFLTILFFIIYFIVQKKSDIKTEIIENSYDSDGDFQMYIDKYYRDLEYFGIFPKKPKTMIIKFSKLDQLNNTTHLHGISYGYNDDDRIEIYINESSWKKFSKPMKYFLMYHELSHDLLNVDDLDKVVLNEGRLMYPALYSYGNKNMDDFIESFQALFEEEAKKRQ
jgi:hypothetical protein